MPEDSTISRQKLECVFAEVQQGMVVVVGLKVVMQDHLHHHHISKLLVIEDEGKL